MKPQISSHSAYPNVKFNSADLQHQLIPRWVGGKEKELVIGLELDHRQPLSGDVLSKSQIIFSLVIRLE
jgi:hypothetical protein